MGFYLLRLELRKLPIAIHYHFRQRFAVSARKAFEWCTNYSPKDHELMGDLNAERKISRYSESTIILTDTFHVDGCSFEKQKLVQLYPEKLFWTSTHLMGPAKYSQFLYQITAEGNDTSNIDFTGVFFDHTHDKMDKAEKEKLSEKLCNEDAEAWILLTKAMEKDLRKK
jgi:hypothetical protein